MSLAADAIRDFVTTALPGWRVQFGRWVDGNKSDRFAVIRPVGGGPAELVRRPQFTVALIGAENEPASTASSAADSLIEAMRISSGSIVSMQPGEPVFMPTSDGRPIFEIAVSAITN